MLLALCTCVLLGIYPEFFAQGRLKRKMSIADSDEEIESIDAKAYKNGLSAYRPSPEHEVSNSEFVHHTLIHGRGRSSRGKSSKPLSVPSGQPHSQQLCPSF